MSTAPYVEAFGCPAVGKTYVTERLLRLAELQDAGIQTELFSLSRARRLSRVAWKVRLIVAALPVLGAHWWSFCSLVWNTPWSSAPAAGRALLNWLQLLAMVQCLHRQERPIVLCQGIFQAVWSLRFRARPAAGRPFPMQQWVSLTLALLPSRPIVVLHVVAEGQVIQARQRGRLGGQSVIDRSRVAPNDAAMVVEEVLAVIDALESSGRVKVVTFDNTLGEPSHRRLCALAHALGLAGSMKAIAPGPAHGLSQVP
ncbi:MAG: hypothetical protein ACXIU5_04550 [Halomonadaceae bacterium]|jgi:hypothetical protein|uniref:hypothetical protein n=1 Tax=Halomonas sp. MCCC 1A11062 TaxID=2733485 RepID=UPI001F33D8B0|nr:hypothetical protein [Halomonas sp. MCCC 1A11062]MCE8037283.1 hypothetical protein [Halomonas sp. MCCC 1A11062]